MEQTYHIPCLNTSNRLNYKVSNSADEILKPMHQRAMQITNHIPQQKTEELITNENNSYQGHEFSSSKPRA
jgi:cobyrinic acid a,c-diamide synthase